MSDQEHDTDEKKTTYVIIQPGKGCPPIRGFDFWLCRWSDLMYFVEEYLDDTGEAEKVSLTFSFHEWTPKELEEFCEGSTIDLSEFLK